MVLVPAGEFIMGTSDKQAEYLARTLRADRNWLKWEQPQRRIYLDAYYIDIYPVTNEQYGQFLAWILQSKDHSRCHPDEPRGKDHTARYWNDPKCNSPQQPVVGVDWWDSYAYAAWAGKRLPTEAEWEKAARGTDGRIWPWGNQWDKSQCNTSDGGPGVTTPVGRYPQGVSPYGCHDMAGNVWEWCADWFAEDYYRRGPLRNPTGPERGSARVLRGGAWSFVPWYARCADRSRLAPASWFLCWGFRCALSPP
jgi:formylglycine-generating enzyme required for sulfatase activity